MCLFDAVEFGSKWHVLLSGILVANRVVTAFIAWVLGVTRRAWYLRGDDIGCHLGV